MWVGVGVEKVDSRWWWRDEEMLVSTCHTSYTRKDIDKCLYRKSSSHTSTLILLCGTVQAPSICLPPTKQQAHWRKKMCGRVRTRTEVVSANSLALSPACRASCLLDSRKLFHVDDPPEDCILTIADSRKSCSCAVEEGSARSRGNLTADQECRNGGQSKLAGNILLGRNSQFLFLLD